MTVERRGLGRGLGGLIWDAGPPASVEQIPVDRIRPNPHQPRRAFDEAALAELAASIRAHGIVQPVVVVPDGEGYVLVAGERRWRAAQQAGLERIPALVRQLDARAMTEMALIENLQREDLNPLEEAHAYRLLQEEFGLTQEQIAERVGKSRPHVANMLRLLQLDPDVQRIVFEGRLSAGHAKVLVTQPPQIQQELARRAAAEGWTVRELERRLQARRRAPRVPAREDPDAEQLARRLEEHLGIGEVRCRRDGMGWRITLRVPDTQGLERLLRRLGMES